MTHRAAVAVSWFGLLLVMVGCGKPHQAAMPTTALSPDKWVSLFNGRDYDGFTFWIPSGPEETFQVENGCMAIRAAKVGFAYTRQTYRNYELSYEWRYDRPADLKDDAGFRGDGGVLLHITVPLLKDWPRSIEVEAKHGEEGKLVKHEKKAGEVDFQATDDPAARKEAVKPVGEWNTMVVRCHDGEIKVTLNGKVVAEGKTANHQEGAIGFMAQHSAMMYRNIRIRGLK